MEFILLLFAHWSVLPFASHAVFSEHINTSHAVYKWKPKTHGIFGVGKLNVRKRLVSVYQGI